VRSSQIFAHVRAASDGHGSSSNSSSSSSNSSSSSITSGTTPTSIENCHPFQCGRYTFMHNGGKLLL